MGRSQGETGQNSFPEPLGSESGLEDTLGILSSVVLNLGLSWLQFGSGLVVKRKGRGLLGFNA